MLNTSLSPVVVVVAGILVAAAVQVAFCRGAHPSLRRHFLWLSAAAEPEAHLFPALGEPGEQTAATQPWAQLLQPQAAAVVRREHSAATRLSQAEVAAAAGPTEFQRLAAVVRLGKGQTAVPASTAAVILQVAVAAALAARAVIPHLPQAALGALGRRPVFPARPSPTRRAVAARPRRQPELAAAHQVAAMRLRTEAAAVVAETIASPAVRAGLAL
jgi:hypothetical protein